jgi:SAM-dependent methyltransferase
MKSDFELKQVVREKYSQIAVSNSSCGCGCGDNEFDYSIMKDDYQGRDGYQEIADLGLGCGIPTDYVNIRKGETVLDLGSGAGNDAFISSKLVGDEGKVIGLDMTEDMIKKANLNKEKLNINNVEFIFGEIENMPLENDIIDVVISNCVLNLVPNKEKAFGEIYRVLKSGGRFSISDIVLAGNLPDKFRSVAELYAGCVSGAISQEEYLNIIIKNGFQNVQIVKNKEIILPDETLRSVLNEDEVALYKSNKTPIKSITVYGEKNG